MKYIYTGRFGGLAFDKIMSLLPLANEYRVPGLVTACGTVLGNSLTWTRLATALPVFQVGMEFGNQALIDTSLAFICKYKL